MKLMVAETREVFDCSNWSLEECRTEYARLCDELSMIDGQLAQNKDRFYSREPGFDAPTYHNWRARAVAAKSHITNEVRQLKVRIAELGSNRASPRDDFRRKCFALVDGLRDIKDNWDNRDTCAGILADLLYRWDNEEL